MYMKQEVLHNNSSQELGSGLGARVYLEDWHGTNVAKKVFDPNAVARLAYRFLRFREHPYAAEYNGAVIGAAFELRRVAHRISRAFGGNVEVVDAIDFCDGELGFYSPFINGQNYSSSDFRVKEKLDLLEHHFQRIGLPVWSFGGWKKEYKRRGNVLVGNDNVIQVVDYEAGVPFFSREGIIGFDDVDVLRFGRFLDLAGSALRFRLGEYEYELLLGSWQRYLAYSAFWRDQKENSPIHRAQRLKDAVSWRSLNERITILRQEDKITDEHAEKLRKALQHNHDLLERIAPHLLVHFATTGLPAGGIVLRPLYTATARAVSEVINRTRKTYDKDKIQIHNITVALTSACSLSIPGVPFASIPLLGYLAYLTNVSREPLGFLILDNIVYRTSGKGLNEYFRQIGKGKIKELIRMSHRLQETQVGGKILRTAKRISGQLISSEVVEKIIQGLEQGALDK